MPSHEMYLEQLRQQQLLQQLAVEQQNLYRQQMEQNNDENNQIEITPEQAAMLLQQLIEKQQRGEQLTHEEVEQFQLLQQVLQNSFPHQQELDSEEQLYAQPIKSTKTKKVKKGKKKKSTKQKIDENALLMMMQNQQNPYQYSHDPESYGVDEIKEVDEEETPIKGLSGESDQIHEGEGEGDAEILKSQQLHPGVHDTDIPNQINAQVPAKFRIPHQTNEGGDTEQMESQKPVYYPAYQLRPEDQENVPVFEGVTPEQLYYLQEMNKNQMIASKLEYYSDFYNPLSKAVNLARK